LRERYLGIVWPTWVQFLVYSMSFPQSGNISVEHQGHMIGLLQYWNRLWSCCCCELWMRCFPPLFFLFFGLQLGWQPSSVAPVGIASEYETQLEEIYVAWLQLVACLIDVHSPPKNDEILTHSHMSNVWEPHHFISFLCFSGVYPYVNSLQDTQLIFIPEDVLNGADERAKQRILEGGMWPNKWTTWAHQLVIIPWYIVILW
jgi:hypothetical protein